MSNIDFETTYQYISNRLTTELSPELYYHGPHHTLKDVLPAAERLAALAHLSNEELLLLRTAALYHDIGYVERYDNNEEIAARIAGETLPAFGYSTEQIKLIQEIILVTALPQQPTTLLEQLMCDADLDSLGRDDFEDTSRNLHRELMARGLNIPLAEWQQRQIDFLRNHRYFSEAARSLRDLQKTQNIRFLESQIAV